MPPCLRTSKQSPKGAALAQMYAGEAECVSQGKGFQVPQVWRPISLQRPDSDSTEQTQINQSGCGSPLVSNPSLAGAGESSEPLAHRHTPHIPSPPRGLGSVGTTEGR